MSTPANVTWVVRSFAPAGHVSIPEVKDVSPAYTIPLWQYTYYLTDGNGHYWTEAMKGSGLTTVAALIAISSGTVPSDASLPPVVDAGFTTADLQAALVARIQTFVARLGAAPAAGAGRIDVPAGASGSAQIWIG
jgi:hypothetical protein